MFRQKRAASSQSDDYINMPIILFFEFGRLGNQLFQYVGLRQCFPAHRLIFFGLDDLHKVVENVDAIFIPKASIPQRFNNRVLRPVISIMSRLHVIGVIQERRRNCSSYSVQSRRGLLWGIYLLNPSYFQHESIVKPLGDRLSIRLEIIEKAESWLRLNLVGNDRQNLVFVQIRRGDYLSWPNRTSPAVLSLAWYHRAMAQMKTKVTNPFFLVLSDDSYYAKDVFRDQTDVLISENDHLVDFALMSLCHHGILSASSFGWWGAWFSRQANAKNDPGIYLAPKYWGGHRRKQWYPQGFVADWLIYIE